ncbi:MAG: hypothetical protein EP340_05675 [Alphaproteobacteria bacterium]|nr:MAG: hypothetical protein EP340_05675 [Alphaproteobacteria bacterium]
MKVYEGQGALAWIIGASPAYPLAAVLMLYVRSLESLDELEQSIHLRALAVATGFVLIAATAYGFLNLHLGLPAFPLILLLPSFLLAWCLAAMLIRRSYQ